MYLRAFAILLSLTVSVHAETLRAGGVGAATQLLPALYAASGEQQVKLEVIPSLGSGGGLRALADGALDFAVSGRLLNAEELKQGLKIVATVRTPFVLVTSTAAPGGLKSSEISGVFSSPKSTWADGSPVRLILRPKSDTDTPILGGMFPGMVAAIETARTRQDVPIAATDQDNADAAERIPGSLAGSTLTQVRTEKRNLGFIAIDGVSPSLEALENGTYPYGKNIYFVTSAKKNPAVEKFLTFVQSAAGKDILRVNGNVLIPNPAAT
jgi:phosphate transport system substrate-binding protein